MKITELVQHSGDSDLLAYTYQHGRLTLVMDINDLDQSVTISVPTQRLYGKELTNEISYSYHLRLSKVSDHLTQTNGMYMPASEFGRFMQETRSGLALAYGMRSHEAAYVLTVHSSTLICACIIADPDLVDVKFEEER